MQPDFLGVFGIAHLEIAVYVEFGLWIGGGNADVAGTW
jgi:hypothetical protein